MESLPAIGFLGPLAPGLLPRSCRFRCTCVHLLL